jgi:SAM-dependent methyltransferase
MEDERQKWNERYGSGSHRSLEPDPFLVEAYREFISPLFPKPGHALDLAGGVGRHAIWLAARNWRVTLVDVSEIGVDQARANAAALADHIDFYAADLDGYALGAGKYELVLGFFYLQRKLFSRLIMALKPGGLLVYKTYTHLAPRFGRGPSHPMHLLQENELLRAFADLTVLYYRETVHERGIAELVARKSLASSR